MDHSLIPTSYIFDYFSITMQVTFHNVEKGTTSLQFISRPPHCCGMLLSQGCQRLLPNKEVSVIRIISNKRSKGPMMFSSEVTAPPPGSRTLPC